MTVDADMWPVDKNAFDVHTSIPAAVHVFDVENDPLYAACYIGMIFSMWREIMGFKKGNDMMEVIAEMRQEDSPGEMSTSGWTRG